MSEPVVSYDAIKAAVAAGVTAVWAAVPDPVVQVVASILGVVLFAGLTWFTRTFVTPLSDPRDADGIALVPAATEGRHALDEPDPATGTG